MKTKTLIKLVCGVSLIVGPLAGHAVEPKKGVEGAAVTTVPAVNNSANNAAQENKTGEVLSYMASAAEFGVAAIKWGECSSKNYSACVTATLFTIMGIQSMQQGKEHGSKASDASYTASLTDAYGTGNYDSTSSSGSDNTKLSEMGDTYLKKAEAGLGSLKSQGYVNSGATKVTAPDGKSYKVSDMNSAAAMQAAGFPKEAIDSAMAAYAQIEKKALDKIKIGAQTAANGYDEDGGSGGASETSGGGSAEYAATGGAGGAGSGSLLNRDPSSLAAGMSKNYNGEPIGVAADSIFLMMTRRYKVKESQDSFFGQNDLNLKK